MPPKRRAQSPLSTRNTNRRIDSEEDDEGADHGLFDYEDEDESEIIVQNEEAKRRRRKRESSMIELSDFLNLSSSQKYT
ncbi:hypothetical protein L596_008906 [Steinernema carpocapsae]|uniref:Uncharacterized protein n=1 Tax=Steinernema carpocapsae TaxID=34508 RepID=A0A4V6A6G4_STECR|nr:hypothetical protein L596_008906 [Steinernema carpocapsae]